MTELVNSITSIVEVNDEGRPVAVHPMSDLEKLVMLVHVTPPNEGGEPKTTHLLAAVMNGVSRRVPLTKPDATDYWAREMMGTIQRLWGTYQLLALSRPKGSGDTLPEDE